MRHRILLAEAWVALAIASLLIALFSFRRVASLASVRGATPPADPVACRQLGWAVDAVARRVPWRAVCFQQGLAAQLMLRRRGRAAALHYGARRDAGGSLVAHVWVRSGSHDVIGCEGAGDYGLLAVFPPAA